MAHDLNKSVDLQIVKGRVEPQTGSKHLGAPHAKEICFRVLCLKTCD
jgi:hypothetical protein